MDHFEECHVVVVDPYTQQAAYVSPAPGTTVKPNTYMTPEQQLSIQQQQQQRLQLDLQQQQQMQQQQHFQQQQQQSLSQSNQLSSHPQQHQQQVGAFDPDDMELDLDSSPSSSASSPPQTPLSTSISPYPTNSAYPAGLSNLQTNLPLSQPHPNYSHLNFNSLSLHSPQSQPNSSCPSPVSAFDTTTVLPSRSSPLGNFPPSSAAQRSNAPADAFNAYSTYAEYNNANGVSAAGMMQQQPSMSSDEWSAGGVGVGGVASEPTTPYGCLPPALLFSNHTTPAGTPAGSRNGSPKSASAAPAYQPLSSQASSSTAGASSSTASASKASKKSSGTSSNPASGKSSPAPRASSSSAAAAASIASRPGASLLLSKPFRCPKPNCNKSYKQANGLKYHMTHGSCNFAPPKDLEALQALLAERAERQALANGGQPGAGGAGGANQPRVEVKLGAGGVVEGLVGVNGMSEGEMREVEREAERRLRPFACGVGECQRRYKNMNGLSAYHFFSSSLTSLY